MQDHPISQSSSSPPAGMRAYHANVAANAPLIPKKKDNMIAMIVSYVLLAAIIVYVNYDGGEPAESVVVVPKVEEPEEKVVLNPVVGSIVLSEPLWLNPPEDINMSVMEEMRVKLQITNHNAYPVTGIKVKFSFYDLTDVDLQGGQEVMFDEVIEASGKINCDDLVVGEYPIDTISIKAEVLAVSAAEE